MNDLIINRPDDWHLHLRDGAAMAAVVGYSARQFARAVVMPNLSPPVTDVAAASAYRQRILDALPAGSKFEPLLSLYLTDNTAVDEVDRAADAPFVVGFKLYPAGATTNSDSGVTHIAGILPVLERMAQRGVVLQVHGEVTDPDIDVFDREAVFIEQILTPIQRELPELRIVLEHITTADAVDFVSASPAQVAATVTPQHLLFNRNELFRGGLRPHMYCLPVLKAEAHRAAVCAAATSGNPKFFLGTDSAPHARRAKESACGCAGIFSAPVALEAYATAFERAGALDRLEGFASHNGADFYGLPRNKEKILLRREATSVPAELSFGAERIVPLQAGEVLAWRFAGTVSA